MYDAPGDLGGVALAHERGADGEGLDGDAAAAGYGSDVVGTQALVESAAVLARGTLRDALGAIPLLACQADAGTAVPYPAAGAHGNGDARTAVPVLACRALIHALRAVPCLACRALIHALRAVPYLACGTIEEGEAHRAVPVLACGALSADSERGGALRGGATASGAASPGDGDGAVVPFLAVRIG